MNFHNLNTFLGNRDGFYPTVNLDHCKTLLEREQSIDDPPEFKAEDIRNARVRFTEDIKHDISWERDEDVQKMIFKNLQEQKKVFGKPWGVFATNSTYLLEIFFTKEKDDISTAVDLKPRIMFCEKNLDRFFIKNAPFCPYPPMGLYYTDENGLKNFYWRNTISSYNSEKFKNLFVDAYLHPPNEPNELFCIFRPFHLSSYIPFLMHRDIEPKYISDEVLVWTANEMRINQNGKTRRQLWKETRDSVFETLYPEMFNREFKAGILLLCVHKFLPQHRIWGSEKIPLDILKVILDFVKGQTYFKSLRESKWRHELPRFQSKFFRKN